MTDVITGRKYAVLKNLEHLIFWCRRMAIKRERIRDVGTTPRAKYIVLPNACQKLLSLRIST